MASLVGEQQISTNSQAAEPVLKTESREGSVERKVAKDREEKLKLARERQNEERQRKIEELKAQAEAAQRYREQKEEERRRRIEEMRQRETDKRHQVEERKRAITEAEKERREYILRKNQERESKLESKKRERNSVAFAFGSSTPRLLEPDFGLVSPSTFLGHRRSTSISNVTGASLSRRSSERELTDSGSKKRATSASGTDRHDGSRSGNVTPGGSISTSRPGSAMSTSTNMSTSGYVARRSVPLRKPRPASIAGTGLSLDEINKHKKDSRPPAKASTPSASAQTTPKRTSNLMSTSMIVSSSTRVPSAEKKTPAKREPVTPKAATPKSLSKTPSSDRLNKAASKDANGAMSKSAYVPSTSTSNNTTLATEKLENATVKTKDEKNASNAAKTESIEAMTPEVSVPAAAGIVTVAAVAAEEKMDEGSEKAQSSLVLTPATDVLKPNTVSVTEAKVEGHEIPVSIESSTNNTTKQQVVQPQQNEIRENSEMRELTPPNQLDTNDMTASMIAKSKITTEEEAKAALAERRRLAREEAERQAELERQRIEAERLAELKRQEEEAERQRQFEEEANRLAEAQRKAEEERLRQAIEEAKQREEEERRKREDEERQRVEREEAERKAKEEAEKQRLEVAERLKREEKEREERRKRVEAIMSRTRKAGTNAATPNSTPVKENNDTSKANENNTQALNQAAQEDQQTNASTPPVVVMAGNSESSSTSGSTTTATSPNPSIPSDLPATAVVTESQNTQAMYEQSVIDKETALINSFSNMIIDENAKNLQQQFQQQHHQHQQPQVQILDMGNGKLTGGDLLHNSTTSTTVANGNGHVENINNKNDINILQDAVPPTSNQLIDLSIESQDINNAVNQFNNNNSLLTTTTNTTSLVTADSHENKDISLL